MIKVFYRPEQSCTQANSFSPSAGKPALVMKDWLSRERIADNIKVVSFEPASRDILYAAHDATYVDGVLDGIVENGFGNKSKAVAKSLPYTVGSMLAAGKYAAEHGMAVSPTSGFHHAGYSGGAGYCTFNGLMATAIELHRMGLRRILILDYDQHYGDGTDDIIDALDIDYVTHYTGGRSYRDAKGGLKILHDLLLLRPKEYDLVIYQAGADIHISDPLGGKMTTNQMMLRDVLVFNNCKARCLPVVWNLAGGYQRDAGGTIEPVLQLHRNTMLACLESEVNHANK